MQTEMKPWIILITHGKLGAEVKGSAEMIAGELKNVYSLSLMEGTDPMDLAMELKAESKSSKLRSSFFLNW